ncbi:hypothetical protein VISI1226_10597 [Vibrio sinaloensis DSM 21326]|uniref:HTH tetR-type domain-containing protein n=1 Tax=Vibrio sinaloensis DSM 21326 TaxID=945550 RepID=E8MAU1_PHOS4|nr:TetR/AcrR family transcriptional regulator [Vibrio sinaloensis]EGA68771.1 hypothetical protein VISI1226_10597 [Vibrio sinaloensis DSM 21326]
MSDTSRKAGRPSEQIDARDSLIAQARELFTVMPYDKVSTRLVANRAGVNVAMIRYYFGSKDGLFETMLRETMAPMREQMLKLQTDSSQANFLDIMRTYYREMSKVPQFPRLILQVMNMSPSDTQRKLMEKVFFDLTQPMQDLMFNKMTDSGILKPGADPRLCKVSYISLMVFPFIAPPAMMSIHGIELNHEFLDKLLEHNIEMMKHGFLNTQGEVDENQ